MSLAVIVVSMLVATIASLVVSAREKREAVAGAPAPTAPEEH